MTITNTAYTVTFLGDGVTTLWNFNYLIEPEDTIIVQTTELATGISTVLLSSQYTVTGLGNVGGGSVLYPKVGDALTGAFTLTISRATDVQQKLDILQNTGFDPTTLERQFDDIVKMIQENQSIKLNSRLGVLAWDFGNKRGTNLAQGVADSDAVTKQQMENQLGSSYADAAALSATQAEAAALVASAAALGIEEKYFGPFANDVDAAAFGNAGDKTLTEGAAYWNTTDNKFRVFDGVVWRDAIDGSSSASIYVYQTRELITVTAAAGLGDGVKVQIEGLYYEVDATKTGTDSATNDLGVDGLVPFGIPTPEHFGPVGDGLTTTAVPAFVALFKYAIDNDIPEISASGNYYMPAGSELASNWVVANTADPSLDIATHYAVLIYAANDLVIDLTGADILTNHGSPFVFYRCNHLKIIGGNFKANGTDAAKGLSQASAIVMAVCWDCVGDGQTVDNYHRNLWAYRCPDSGFVNYYSLNATYFTAYISSVNSLTIVGAPTKTWMFLRNGYHKGGRYGGAFCDNGEVVDCVFHDLATAGNNGTHISTQYGNCVWTDNVIKETQPQNGNPGSLDSISGIAFQPTISVGGPVHECLIKNNTIEGGYYGIRVSGAINFQIQNNYVSGYYQTGISLLTAVYGPAVFTLQNGVCSDNTIGAMADNSTQGHIGNDKNCGLQVEENIGAVFSNVIVADNAVDAKGANVVKSPLYGGYFECQEGTVSGITSNMFTNTSVDIIPAWALDTGVLRPGLYVSSFGTAAAPASLDLGYYKDGIVHVYNSNIRLPPAVAGYAITFISSASVNRIYLNGATVSALSTDRLYLPGGSPNITYRNAQTAAPTHVEVVCGINGVWVMNDCPGAILV